MGTSSSRDSRCSFLLVKHSRGLLQSLQIMAFPMCVPPLLEQCSVLQAVVSIRQSLCAVVSKSMARHRRVHNVSAHFWGHTAALS